MKQKTTRFNVVYLKRLAKQIKKEQSITHQKALDTIATNNGFNNWKHLLNSQEENSKKSFSKVEIQTDQLSESKKVNPYRNLLIGALNHLITGKHISLEPNNTNSEKEDGHVFCNLIGHSSVIIWNSISYDELLIAVWWKYDHSKHPQANLEGNSKENFNLREPLARKQHYKKFVGVVTSCWFERRSGKYLQGKDQEYIARIYTRKGELENLKKIPTQKPQGFQSSGRFYL